MAGLGKMGSRSYEWHIFGSRPWISWISGTQSSSSAAPPGSTNTTTIDAVALSLCIDRWLTPPGFALRALFLSRPWITLSLTAATLVLEAVVAPIFVCGPLTWVLLRPTASSIQEAQWLRGRLVPLFASFAMGLGLMLRLGLFPMVMVVGICVHLPSKWWEGSSYLSQSFSHLLRKRRAVAQLLRAVIVDMAGCDEKTTCTSSSSDTSKLQTIRTRRRWWFSWFRNAMFRVFASCYLVLSVCGNLKKIDDLALREFPVNIPGMQYMDEHVLFMLQIQQHWTMFDRGVATYGGWMSVEGMMHDIKKNATTLTTVDVLRSLRHGSLVMLPDPDAPPLSTVTMDEHLDVPLFAEQRWLMLWSEMRLTNKHNPALGKLLCASWNERDDLMKLTGSKLEHFTMRFEQTKTTGIRTGQKVGDGGGGSGGGVSLCEYEVKTYDWYQWNCTLEKSWKRED